MAAAEEKRGLAKSALDRIAMAAGVSWDAAQSRRIDDGRDPRYCAWLAVGRVRSFDGQEIIIQGSKEIDLRDRSPQVEALVGRYRAKLERWEQDGRKGYAPKDPSGQIREMRLHILSMCETKARLRAIRSLGVRTAYSPADLRKPFVVAHLSFSGRSEDPQLRREFALMAAHAALAPSRSTVARLPAAPAPPLLPPPPIGQTMTGELDVDDAVFDEGVEAPPAATAPPAGEATSAHDAGPAHADTGPSQSYSPPSEHAPPPRTRAAARAAASGFAIPGGRSKGTPLEEADDRDLTYWGGRLEEEIAAGTGKPQFRDRNEGLARAIRAEQGRRAGGGGDFEAEGRARGDDDSDIPFASSTMRTGVHPRAARWERW